MIVCYFLDCKNSNSNFEWFNQPYLLRKKLTEDEHYLPKSASSFSFVCPTTTHSSNSSSANQFQSKSPNKLGVAKKLAFTKFCETVKSWNRNWGLLISIILHCIILKLLYHFLTLLKRKYTCLVQTFWPLFYFSLIKMYVGKFEIYAIFIS